MLRRSHTRLKDGGALAAYTVYFGAIGTLAALSVAAGGALFERLSHEANRQALASRKTSKPSLSRVEQHEIWQSRIAGHVPVVYGYVVRPSESPQTQTSPSTLAAALDAAEEPDLQQFLMPVEVHVASLSGSEHSEVVTVPKVRELPNRTRVALLDAGPDTAIETGEQKSLSKSLAKPLEKPRLAKASAGTKSAKPKKIPGKKVFAAAKQAQGKPSKVAASKGNTKIASPVQRFLKPKHLPGYAETPSRIMMRILSGITS